jgi:hypothetical protein
MSDLLDVQPEERLRAAAFLCEALGFDLDPAVIAPDVAVLKNDPFARVYTAELESTVGTAAFLIYQYLLTEMAPDGRNGHEIFKADLETLEIAAERDAPGPRILAHATTDDEAYILATTPAIHRALMGLDDSESIEATESDLPPGSYTAAIRRESADELLRLLKLSNDQARRWLAAMHSEGLLARSGEDLAFGQEEAALALYLIDDKSIQDLLRLLSVMVDATRRQAASPPSSSKQDE